MLFQISFYVPESHKEQVKAAIFAAGAGKYQGYDCCSWECLGQGQFRPLAGSKPFIGEQNKIEMVSEYKVETLCQADDLSAVIHALKNSHPYETPAYAIVKFSRTAS